jgi:hypothetical protein
MKKTAAITITEYQGFQRAYDFFNRKQQFPEARKS